MSSEKDPLLAFDPSPVLRRALVAGGYESELFLEDTARSSVSYVRGAVDRLYQARDRGLSVRVLTEDGRAFLASATTLDPADALELADALHGLPLGPSGPWAGPGAPIERTMEVLDPPEAHDLPERIAWLARADQLARSGGPAVREVELRLHHRRRRFAVASSSGRWVRAESVAVLFSVEIAVERDGRREVAFESAGGAGGFERLSLETIETTVRIASARALRLLDARPSPAGRMAVVLAAEAGGTFVHETVGHPLEADLVAEQLSLFGDQRGERIGTELLTVVDDPTLAGLNGSYPVDDEGTEAARRVLIERGVLKDFLFDRQSARRLGREEGGHARRASFRQRPIVRMSNTLILPGSDDPEQILRDTREGLYVVRMGGGEVDTITGEFVFEAAEAYRIEQGAIGEPVRGATLAGNTAEVLHQIDRIGRDLGFGIGICGKDGQDVPVADGEPTLRIPELVVGGPAGP